MQRSSWCQCQAFCLPFRTSLDPECPKNEKSGNQLKDMMVFFEPYEEFECLNNVLVPKSYPSYHPQPGNTFWFCFTHPQVPSPSFHPVTFPSKQPSSSVDAASALPFPLPSLDWGGLWMITHRLVVFRPTPLKNDGVKVRLDHHPNYWGKENMFQDHQPDKYSTTSIWNHQHHSLWF